MRFIFCLFAIPIIFHSSILGLALNYGEATSLAGKINEDFLLTIQGPNGDIIDCVDKIKQPSFEHSVHETIWVLAYILLNNITKHWWLKVDDMEIGYWPSKLFSLLGDGATKIEWGGEVHNQGRGVTKHTTTEMGSGKFATERYEKACYAGNLFVTEKDMDGTLVAVQLMLNNTNSIVTHPKCYSLIAVENLQQFWVYFGGPGYGNGCTT